MRHVIDPLRVEDHLLRLLLMQQDTGLHVTGRVSCWNNDACRTAKPAWRLPPSSTIREGPRQGGHGSFLTWPLQDSLTSSTGEVFTWPVQESMMRDCRRQPRGRGHSFSRQRTSRKDSSCGGRQATFTCSSVRLRTCCRLSRPCVTALPSCSHTDNVKSLSLKVVAVSSLPCRSSRTGCSQVT